MPKATLLLAALAAHAAPDDKLLAAARAAQPAVIESLREMVGIESGTMDAPGIGKMADCAEAPDPGVLLAAAGVSSINMTVKGQAIECIAWTPSCRACTSAPGC